jgi:flavodoxin
MFELDPADLLEVQIRHPLYGWFAELNIKWYAIPAMSSMRFNIGGLRYTAAPFNSCFRFTFRAFRFTFLAFVSLFVLSFHFSCFRFTFRAFVSLFRYAIPAVSSMGFDIGGLRYTAAPFNGWYMVTEVATRNFGDVNRYNMLPDIAQRMGLNPEVNASLWIDQALAVLSVAVMHSFSAAGVSMVDHHSTADKFFTWYQQEMKTRGYCPGNWKWIVPPMASSTSRCYLELNKMVEFTVKPCVTPLTGWPRLESGCAEFAADDTKRRENSTWNFHTVITALRFTIKMRNLWKCTHKRVAIVYATESGHTKEYADQAARMLRKYSNVQVANASAPQMCWELIRSAELVLFMTSTFGSGDPPQSAEKFVETIRSEAKHVGGGGTPDGLAMTNRLFAVFGLGSSVYAKFCGTQHDWPDSVNNWPDCVNNWADSVNNWADSVNNWPDSVNNWPDSVNNWPDSVNNWPDSTHQKPHTDCTLLPIRSPIFSA